MKAQIWSFDFAVSVIFFITIITVLIFAWNYTNTQSIRQLQFNEIEITALTASDSLIRIPGLPKNWNETNVDVIGLAKSCDNGCENMLNDSKTVQFVNLTNYDYQMVRSLLTDKYHFYFEMRYLNNTVIEDAGISLAAGNSPPSNASIVVPVERYVLYKEKMAKLSLIVWI